MLVTLYKQSVLVGFGRFELKCGVSTHDQFWCEHRKKDLVNKEWFTLVRIHAMVRLLIGCEKHQIGETPDTGEIQCLTLAILTADRLSSSSR
jgi:hypothetical protein